MISLSMLHASVITAAEKIFGQPRRAAVGGVLGRHGASDGGEMGRFHASLRRKVDCTTALITSLPKLTMVNPSTTVGRRCLYLYRQIAVFLLARK